MATTTGSRRDTIAIAFTDSHYATPYTDQSIPGSTPGHRVRHLGRAHQPVDILYNHLSHALVAHGDGGGYGSSADHPTPPGGNYVLHSKNGGRRHYEEVSGMGSEKPWQPSKRVVVPAWEAAVEEGQASQQRRGPAPQRRGRGVFNTMDGFIHPDAQDAQRQREQVEQRRHERGGKARVSGPLDHSLADLGMMQHQPQQQQRLAAAAQSRRASSMTASAAAAGVQGVEDGAAKAATDVPRGPSTSTFAKESNLLGEQPSNTAHYGHALLASTGPNVPPARGTAAEADAVAEYHRDQRMRCALDQRKGAMFASARRAADVQSVRELPNW